MYIFRRAAGGEQLRCCDGRESPQNREMPMHGTGHRRCAQPQAACAQRAPTGLRVRRAWAGVRAATCVRNERTGVRAQRAHRLRAQREHAAIILRSNGRPAGPAAPWAQLQRRGSRLVQGPRSKPTKVQLQLQVAVDSARMKDRGYRLFFTSHMCWVCFF